MQGRSSPTVKLYLVWFSGVPQRALSHLSKTAKWPCMLRYTPNPTPLPSLFTPCMIPAMPHTRVHHLIPNSLRVFLGEPDTCHTCSPRAAHPSRLPTLSATAVQSSWSDVSHWHESNLLGAGHCMARQRL